MAAGANLGEKLFGMVKTIGPVFQSYAPGLGLLDLAVGVAGAVILYFVVQSKIKKARKFRRDMEYGSARWGTEADIKPFVDPKCQQKNAGLRQAARNACYARHSLGYDMGGGV